jgi:hypothetical protein
MPIYNPKQLGEPEVIREINPTVLCAFLKPFEGYLRTRGLEVREPSRIDNAAIEKLVDILINPTMKTPQRLLHAVFYVEEMSSPLAADSLLKLAIQAGMPFDENENHTLADVVMQVWLFDSKLVESQHAWQTWKTPRRMECFQPVQSTGIAPITITEDRLNLAIKDAGDWFAKNNRGRKLFMTPRIVNNEIQISIRRGDRVRVPIQLGSHVSCVSCAGFIKGSARGVHNCESRKGPWLAAIAVSGGSFGRSSHLKQRFDGGHPRCVLHQPWWSAEGF